MSAIKQTFQYRFEVKEHEDADFFSVGGNEDTAERARLNHENYMFSRDKRRKVPPMRLVEICTTETVLEELT